MARNDEPERRRFLLAAGGASAAATLAGCTSSGAGGNGDGTPPAPKAELLDRGGWAERSSDSGRLFEREFLGGQVTVTADAETTVYGDAELRRTLNERTMGGIDTSLALFSVTRVLLSPNPADLPMGLGVDRVLKELRKRASEQFETMLADSGLSNVRRRADEELALADGRTTNITVYGAAYEYDGMRVPLPGGKSTSIEGGAIDVAGMFAVWRAGRHVVVAGGAHPASNVVRSVSEELSDAITVDVDVDLGLTPEAYGRELRGLIASIE